MANAWLSLWLFVPAAFASAQMTGAIVFDVMPAPMLSIRQRYEIFRAVIVRNAVNVVNMLARFKAAPVGLLPYKAMLRDVTFRVSARVVGQVKQYIAAIINATAFPHWVFRTKQLWSMSANVPSGLAFNCAHFLVRARRNGSKTPTSAKAEAGGIKSGRLAPSGLIHRLSLWRVRPAFQRVPGFIPCTKRLFAAAATDFFHARNYKPALTHLLRVSDAADIA